ncbi:hypothetical protein [Methylobacterium sp. WL19]|uniref:hypothetical protein n=1 Tax=Methylobacterium sp. WL19 TaxID=2603896 RepID=UPI0011C70B05|nr:hypothetical protein [Methylobacterium sp. WL19]TXN33880.1 hypothetical protein FV220_00055 [Methylobacterium sp. WL19]
MALADDSGAIPAAIPIVGPAGLSIVGPQGKDGPEGKQGPVGPMGSVSPEQLQSAVAPVDARVARLEVSLQTGYITRQTYAEIAALTLSATATYVVPDTDTGTHAGVSTEVGYSGGQVPNAGTFSATGSPLALRRVASTGTAAIPGIQTSVALLNRARSDYRPGDLLAAWTTQVSSPEATATPLSEGGQYVLADGADGRVLRITPTGSVGVGPIKCDPIYADRTYDYTLIDQRITNGSSSTVLLRLSGFTAANALVGPVTILTQALVSADLQQKPFVRLTGAAILALLPNAVKARPYVSLTSSSGTFDLSAIARSTASDLASVTSQASVLSTIPDDQLFATLGADRKITSLINFAALKDLVMEKFYNRTVTFTATSDSTQALPADPFRNSIDILNSSTSTSILISFDQAPVRGQAGTRPLAPGEGYFREHPPTGPLYIKSEGENVPLVFDFTNSNNSDPLKYSLADAYIAKSAYVPSSAERDIFAKFFNTIRDASILPLLGTAAILGGPSRTLSLQDIVRNVTYGQVNPTSGTSITFTKYVGFTGNGSDQYLRSMYIPAQDTGRFLANSHSFGAVVNAGIQGTTPILMGSYTTGLQPQRSVDSQAVRSATVNSTVVTINAAADGGSGGMYAVLRNAADKCTLIHRKTAYEVAQAATGLGSGNQELFILAQNTSGGTPTAFSTLTPTFVWAGGYMTPAQTAVLLDAEAEMHSAFLALGA